MGFNLNPFNRNINADTVIGLTESGRALASDGYIDNITGRLEEGSKSVRTLAQEVGIPTQTMVNIVNKLHNRGIIRPIGG